MRSETVATHTGRRIDTQFEVVSAASLRAASGNYQPRDRKDRDASERQITKIKNELDPPRLGSSPEADRGAPIVGPVEDSNPNMVESGNGRRDAIARAYAEGLPQADAYRQWIASQGYAIPEGVTDPILIRRRTTPLDDANRQAFIDEANVDSTARLSPTEQGRTDARGLTHDMLGRLNPDLRDGVLAAGNADFVRSWMATIPESQRGELMGSNGQLNVKGQQRLQGAIVSRAYDDKATIERLLESTDDNTKAISHALTDAAPAMARLKAGIAEGHIPKELDIAPDLIRAAELTKNNRDAGQAPMDILNSGDMFNPLSDTVKELVRVFHNDAMNKAASRTRIANVLRQYAQEAAKQTTNGLVPGKLDPAKFIADARAKAAKDNEKPAQGGLFGGPANPPEPAPAAPEPAAPAPIATPPASEPAPRLSGEALAALSLQADENLQRMQEGATHIRLSASEGERAALRAMGIQIDDMGMVPYADAHKLVAMRSPEPMAKAAPATATQIANLEKSVAWAKDQAAKHHKLAADTGSDIYLKKAKEWEGKAAAFQVQLDKLRPATAPAAPTPAPLPAPAAAATRTGNAKALAENQAKRWKYAREDLARQQERLAELQQELDTASSLTKADIRKDIARVQRIIAGHQATLAEPDLNAQTAPAAPAAPAPAAAPTARPRSSTLLRKGNMDELSTVPPSTPATVHTVAANWAVKAGAADGFEHIAFVDNTGGEIVSAATDFYKGSASFALPKGHPDSVTLHHNHPMDTALSPADVSLLSLQTISHVAAHGPQNSYYATLTPKSIAGRDTVPYTALRSKLMTAVKDAEKKVRPIVQDALNAGNLTEENANAHFYDLVHRYASAGGLYDFVSSRAVPAVLEAPFTDLLRAKGVRENAIGRYTNTVRRASQLAQIHRDAQARSIAGGASGKSAGMADLAAPDAPDTITIDDTKTADGQNVDNLFKDGGLAERPAQPDLPELPPDSYSPNVSGSLSADPNRTERPSDFVRQAMQELGVADPIGMVSKPLSAQRLVLQRAVVAKYGLANVHISESAQPRETVDQLADAHRNMQWMAHAMGVPNAAIGLNGTLSLWLGPRDAPEVTVGPGQFALGVYRPDNRTIYMPGRSNSFAHEWTHALDHALVQDLAKNPQRTQLLSLSAADWADAPAGTPAAGFAHVMASIFGRDVDTTLRFMRAQEAAARAPTPHNTYVLKQARAAYQASDFYRRAAAVGGPFSTYLTQPYEMLARSHEAYVSNRVSELGGTTQFITKQESAYLNEASRQMQSQYPKGDDRLRIFAAWDQLHDRLRAAALYPQGPGAPVPANDALGLGPSHWGQWANPAANSALTRALAARANSQINRTTLWAEARRRLGFDPEDGSDPGYLTGWEHTKDAFRAPTFSPRAKMNVIHDRAPAAAQPIIRRLIDQLTTDPGSGRHVGETFEEEVQTRDTHDFSDYAAIAERAGVAARITGLRTAPRLSAVDRQAFQEMMTQRQDLSALPRNLQKAVYENTIHQLPKAAQDRIYNAMVTAPRPAHVTDRIARLAAGVRVIFDRKFYELRQAGLEVDYTDGMLPRVFDDYRVLADPQGFLVDAIRAKTAQSRAATEGDGELIRSVFHELQSQMDPQTVAAIRAELRATDALRRASPPPAGTQLTAADVIRDPALVDAIDAAWGQREGERWQSNILVGAATSYDTRGPRGDSLKSRVLPPEADQIMQRWLLTDPHALVPTYVHQMNRKIAFARRFGPTGQGINDAMKAAEAGGLRGEEVADLRRLVNVVTGQNMSNKWPKAMVRGLETVHAYGTMALMSRAAFSAVMEPLTVMMRTGSLRATYEGFAHMVREAVGTADTQRIAEIAEYLGVVSNTVFEATQTDRTGAHYRTSQKLNTMMINFFRMTGLSALTRAQRRAGLVSLSFWLHSVTDTILHHTPGQNQAPPTGHAARRSLANAQAYLRDLGIADHEQLDFSRWLSHIEGMPDISELSDNGMIHANGARFRTAAVRFVNQVNQAPSTSEKPEFSQDPLGRLVWGLLGFNFSFQANVTERFLKDAERQVHNESSWSGRARVAGGIAVAGAAGALMLWFGQTLMSVLRESTLNGESWDEHKQKGDLGPWLASLGWNRTGFNGTWDPLMQAMHGLKYNKSMGSLFMGAQIGYIVDNLEKVIEAFNRRSPHTNTSTYNGYVGAYNLLAVPAIAAAMTAIPGFGPLPRLVSAVTGATTMKLTSRGAADSFAEFMSGGPKGTGDETTIPDDPGAAEDARLAREDQEADNPPKDTGSTNLGPAAALVDDFIPLIARGLAALPGKAKIGLGVIGAGYAAKELWDEAHRYTGAPPPDKR